MEEVLFDLGFESFEDPTLPNIPLLIAQGSEKEAIRLRERMDVIKGQSDDAQWSRINDSIRDAGIHQQKRSRTEKEEQGSTPWFSNVRRILDRINEA